MTKPPHTQSQKRYAESLAPLFGGQGKARRLLFLKSSSDVGVMRNGGRNGARYAPQSFLSVFKKFNQDHGTRDYDLHEAEVASVEEEEADFVEAQKKQGTRIKALLNSHKGAVCHLGGGHDHIYPLLTAAAGSYDRVMVINVDAHADTRTDDAPNSGTPFRQFAEEFPGDFHLFQVGLHPFANSASTLSPLERGTMSVLWKEELKDPERLGDYFKSIGLLVKERTLVVFSLDADAMDGSEVPGVSAVNADGLTREELLNLWRHYRNLPLPHAPMVGIYELNPVFDTPSSLSMRRMAAFIYEILKK